MKTSDEPQFRIYWRAGDTDQTKRSTGTYSRKVAELWVNALNKAKGNRRLGLEYWIEEEAS